MKRQREKEIERKILYEYTKKERLLGKLVRTINTEIEILLIGIKMAAQYHYFLQNIVFCHDC